jgi:hypothetical protein
MRANGYLKAGARGRGHMVRMAMTAMLWAGVCSIPACGAGELDDGTVNSQENVGEAKLATGESCTLPDSCTNPVSFSAIPLR